VAVGRSYRDAPEVDGVVLVQGEPPLGELARVRVQRALEYDLVAVPIASPADPAPVAGASGPTHGGASITR
jgi:ribosomal protein S12 methylthiotransferase